MSGHTPPSPPPRLSSVFVASCLPTFPSNPHPNPPNGRYLKTIKRTGLGFAAFAELRYSNPNDVAKHGPEVAIELPDFVLNTAPYRESTILIAGDNFGCGSSREHAPWSISGFGIRSIISTRSVPCC